MYKKVIKRYWWFLIIVVTFLIITLTKDIPEVYLLNSGGIQYYIHRDTGDTLAILMPMILLEDLERIETIKEWSEE